jgi:equilibrative nucleoside transporter 1/2/3
MNSGNQSGRLVPPEDRYNIVYSILVMLGVGTVLPWNTFLNANDYYVNYKLSDTPTVDMSPYRSNFASFIGMFAAGANLIIQVVNIFYDSGASFLRKRIMLSIGVEMSVILFTLVMVVVDTTTWPITFFYVTMVTVAVLNMAAGFYQNSAMAVSANLPMKYTNAIVIGMNTSGTALALTMIISLLISSDMKIVSLVYFASAFVFLIIVLVLYAYLFRNEFYIYHNPQLLTKNKNSEDRLGIFDSLKSETVLTQSTLTSSNSSSKADLRRIFKVFQKCWPQCLNIFLTFWLSLSIFPVIQVMVAPLDSIMPIVFFAPVTCFLTFNTTALFGNLLVEWIPRVPPNRLWIPVTLRILLIPLFLFCNFQPLTGRSWSVWIQSDWIYWMLACLLGTSSGYLSSLGLMYAPHSVVEEDSQVAGMLGGLSLITGIFGGICTSFIWPIIVR